MISALARTDEIYEGLKVVLEKACQTFSGEYMWCDIGAPIDERSKKYFLAVQNFNMPRSSTLYIIYDETMFGSCKKGFALCESGIYFKQTTVQGHIPWENFVSLNLSAGITGIRIGNLLFSTDQKTSAAVLAVLRKVQDAFLDMGDDELDTLFDNMKKIRKGLQIKEGSKKQ